MLDTELEKKAVDPQELPKMEAVGRWWGCVQLLFVY